MVCKAKERGEVSRRGEPSIEWYKDGEPQYYCCGYIDKMTDELLTECKECRSHVHKAQGDLDEYNHRKRNDHEKVYRVKVKGCGITNGSCSQETNQRRPRPKHE